VARRDLWAGDLAAQGGLAVSGDPLDALDHQGLTWTHALLIDPAPGPARWDADPDDVLGGPLVREDR
jgi:hypothetical protein